MNGSASIRRLRVAVASSGLGHVRRGIEAWAEDLGHALRDAGIEVRLFGAGPGDHIHQLPCLRRTSANAIRLARAFRHLGGWRYGLGCDVDVEQTSFALALLPHICRGTDILHVQEPMIASLCEAAYRLGISRAKVIYANGTGEEPRTMRRFTYMQLLTPGVFDTWQPNRPASQSVFVVPNFIDTNRFSPGDRRQARAKFNLPQDYLIVVCCAAIRRYHKRIDYLLSEFSSVIKQTDLPVMLVIAGGHTEDTDELMAHGTALLGNRVLFLRDVPRERMPDLYRCGDLFVLPSLYEMFGIVLLEAMASALPVICHDSSDFRSIVGPGGLPRDLTNPGSLAAAIIELLPPSPRIRLADEARSHVEKTYSTRAVLPAILDMYSVVAGEAANVVAT